MRPLKLFFQLPYNAAGWQAELELTRRFEIVSRRLGHECLSSCSIRDATDLGADYVFALHFESAKVSPLFTVGLIWNPLAFMKETGPRPVLQSLTHDAHFYGGEGLRGYFSDLNAQGYRTNDLGNFYPSAPRTDFVPIENYGVPVYIGALWQNERHRDLFTLLNERRDIFGYGPRRGWNRYPNLYRGSVALDGESYQAAYRSSGIGLCLHSEEHLRENIPATRIFEIVSSGCVAVCDEHAFVREHFGESVCYLESGGTAKERAAQIRALAEDIRSHPKRANEMARAAHDIFVRTLSLDHLLGEALRKISQVRETGHRNFLKRTQAWPTLQIFTRTRGLRPHLLRRALASLAAQTYPEVKSTLIYHGPASECFLSVELPLLKAEFPKLPIDAICLNAGEPLSESIPLAVRHADADCIGFLDDDDWYFPEHLETLVDALEAKPPAALALSGAALHWERSLNLCTVAPVNSLARDSSELLSFEPLNAAQLEEGDIQFCFSMFLFRRSQLPEDWSCWPRLELGEDRALLTLLCRAGRTAAFTSRVSSAWTYRHLQSDNQVDRIFSEEVSSRQSLFRYKSLHLAYPHTSGHEPGFYRSPALAQKCAAAKHLFTEYRWAPRGVRPLLYQRKLNRLVVSILEDLAQMELFHPRETVCREFASEALRDPVERLASTRRQPEFNRQALEMLAIRPPEIPPHASQHEINLAITRTLERLATLF